MTDGKVRLVAQRKIGTAGRQPKIIIRSLCELDNKWCGHGAPCRTDGMDVRSRPREQKKTWLRVGNFKGVIVKTTDDGEMAKAQLRALYEVFSFFFFFLKDKPTPISKHFIQGELGGNIDRCVFGVARTCISQSHFAFNVPHLVDYTIASWYRDRASRAISTHTMSRKETHFLSSLFYFFSPFFSFILSYSKTRMAKFDRIVFRVVKQTSYTKGSRRREREQFSRGTQRRAGYRRLKRKEKIDNSNSYVNQWALKKYEPGPDDKWNGAQQEAVVYAQDTTLDGIDNLRLLFFFVL